MAKAGINAILGVGFDPGVVNAWAALAVKHHFDKIDTIDIMDVNAGSHGRYFATNFDPEINFREFKKVWTWINRKWVERPVHSERWDYDFPVVGERPVYLNGHDELHSLSKNIDAKSIRFWMGFGDHYLNVFGVLRNLGMLSEKPVTTAEGVTSRSAQGAQSRPAGPGVAGQDLQGLDLHRRPGEGLEGRQVA